VTNPWLERRVLNYAHQGGAKEGPSSTLWAMRRAVGGGAHAIELDVHMTADRQIVVCHDATVDRTTNGSGAIADMTLAEVQSLDNAYWWVEGSVVDHDATDDSYLLRGRAPEDPELRICTLAEVLQTFPDVFLNLDIKQTAPAVESYEAVLADVLREHGGTDRIIVASFEDRSTEIFREHAPEIATSVGTNGTAEIFFALRDGREPPATPHVALQVPASFGETRVVTAEFVEGAHRHGLAVHVWTIDDPSEMTELVDLGVDGVITDRPSLFEAVLTDKGVRYEP
jgi:glycerophosphoryl diester phosphodiesterase